VLYLKHAVFLSLVLAEASHYITAPVYWRYGKMKRHNLLYLTSDSERVFTDMDFIRPKKTSLQTDISFHQE